MERRLARKALNHWREWLPAMYADLERNNQLVSTAAANAEMAAREILELMAAGARLDEAEEIVLPKYILLPPEERPEEPEEEPEQLDPTEKMRRFNESLERSRSREIDF